MAKEYGRCFFKCNNGAKKYIDPKEKNFKNSKKKMITILNKLITSKLHYMIEKCRTSCLE
jgi:hypothetical protein